ncbi:TRAP transporter substrate-binding protein DctP [Planomicrobium sp. YIM 101495]|uniref:TRAP transporter substrate-binding protein DctP n=1 Tax=Planomicrobium sp. YIM 101495 TaxID=2665160 RepID=UPI0012B7EA11|nr:TRAP transporter substrate-binding protein DctP [Planomicrobium sp. YIM 101495]MTD30760.1 C4-dicarboxylate ABC transporter [Planomicrobium sp. YIM 101495]
MQKKWVLSLVLILALAVLAACGSGDSGSADGDGEVTWKLNHIRPADTRTDVSANEFVDNVMDSTEGRVNIEIYDNSQLGDYQLVQESVSTGEIEMQLATLGTSVDPTLQVAIAPYLVTNWEEAKQLYNSEDGMMNKYLSEQLEKQNIKLLAVYPQYFGSVFLAKDAVDPKNPEVSKDLKIRVPAMKSFEEFGKGIGFIVTPLPASEMFTSLQTGVVDGVLGGGTELYYNQLSELGEYVLPINTHFEAHYLTVNKDKFESLSEKDQEAILNVAKEFETKAFAQAEEEQNKYNELIEEEGVEVIELTDEEVKVFADKVRKDVWPLIEDEYGSIFQDIKTELGIEN